MKERILDSLKELAGTPEERNTSTQNQLLPLLIAETRLTEEEIQRKAGEALRLILHVYSDLLSIGTIDSFSHRIIRDLRTMIFGLPRDFKCWRSTDDEIIDHRCGSPD